jgi:hypothetical protein
MGTVLEGFSGRIRPRKTSDAISLSCFGPPSSRNLLGELAESGAFDETRQAGDGDLNLVDMGVSASLRIFPGGRYRLLRTLVVPLQAFDKVTISTAGFPPSASWETRSLTSGSRAKVDRLQRVLPRAMAV